MCIRDSFRADKLIEDYAFAHHLELDVAAMDNKQMEEFIAAHIPCPTCGKNKFTPIRKFNLMFKTFKGVKMCIRDSAFVSTQIYFIALRDKNIVLFIPDDMIAINICLLYTSRCV